MAENGNGVARLGTWASVAGAAFLILAAMFGLFYSATAASQKADALEIRVKALEAQDVVERTEIGALCSDLVEVETQFKASDQLRNLMHKESVNQIALLWHRAYKEEMPTADTYLPTIAQEQPAPCS